MEPTNKAHLDPAQVKEVVRDKPKYIESLKKVVDYAQHNKEPDRYLIKDKRYDHVFTHSDIAISGQRLYQLEVKGILERVMDTNSTTAYSVVDVDAVAQALDEVDISTDGTERVMHEFPAKDDLDGIFDDVVGYPRIKELFKRAMTTDTINNIVLVGPPGSAKSVFLMCIRELQGAEYVVASDATGAGFLDVMFSKKPRYVLLDELDDMDGNQQDSLSSYMETGIVKETKYGKTRQMKTNAKTFAAANEADDIECHILDRMVDLHFEPYTLDEFKAVCEHVVPRKTDTTTEEATQIAQALWKMRDCADVRKAIDVAELSEGDPEWVIETLDIYSDEDD